MTDHSLVAESAIFSARTRPRGRTGAAITLIGLIGDTLVVFFALVFSSWLRFETTLAHYGFKADSVLWTDYIQQAAFGTLLFVLLLPHREMYDLHRILRFRRILPMIAKTALWWLLVFMAFAWVFRTGHQISRIYLSVAFLVTIAVFALWRLLLNLIVSSERIASRLRRRILFVGWSGRAASLVRAIAADRRHPYIIVGYVPFSPFGGGESPESGGEFVPWLGGAGDVPDILRNREIDMVVLADPDPGGEETLKLAGLCEKEMIDFKVIPGCFETLVSCLELQTVSGVPVLGNSHLPLNEPFSELAKQAVDLVGGVVGFLLSAPIVCLFGLLVYWESPGPIIYRQRRVGRDGREFWMFKIRSMRLDAESGGKVGWTVKNDPRRLRVGAFMRRWNIDELPQFWNVIKGEMSLVGPRPERPELIERFKEEIPHYNARHGIKPGLTGWAQVNGLRGDTDLNERVRCDLYYMENWSLFLDLQIMAMTLFKRTNAG